MSSFFGRGRGLVRRKKEKGRDFRKLYILENTSPRRKNIGRYDLKRKKYGKGDEKRENLKKGQANDKIKRKNEETKGEINAKRIKI